MRRILVVSLLLAATTASADHVWRLWCGTPPTARTGAFDTEQRCTSFAFDWPTAIKRSCVDTPEGPRYITGEVMEIWQGFRTCAEVQRDATCTCRPELLK
jgi:hypothetical protein